MSGRAVSEGLTFFAAYRTMAKKKTQSRGSSKKKTKKVSRNATRCKRQQPYTKFALKSRAEKSIQRMNDIQAALEICQEHDIGAIKYFKRQDADGVNYKPPDCPLDWSHKSALDRAIQRGIATRHGGHCMLMTAEEEADLANAIVKRAHEKRPMTWTTIGEAVIAAVDNRKSGPVGRKHVKSGRIAARAINNGTVHAAWRHAFCGRNGIKNFKPEDIGHSRAKSCNEHNKNAYFSELKEELARASSKTSEGS